MPDIITHILCGEKTVEKIYDATLRNEVINRRKLFNIGCQGPDIFLYYKIWPWSKHDQFSNLGELLHKEKTGDFLYESILYLGQFQNNSEEFYDLFTYIIGLICHYNLDRLSHPYINYFSGINDGTPEKKKYSNYHKRLEIIIDFMLLEKYKNKLSSKEKIYNYIKYEPKNMLPEKISIYYKSIIKEIYNIELSDFVVNSSIDDMYKVQRLFHDPLYIKEIALKAYNYISKKDLIYSYAVYPHKIQKEKDYLNLRHNQWVHPCDNNEIFTYSFIDLFEQSINISTEMINLLTQYVLKKDVESLKKLKSFFKNVTYNTNKENLSNYKMQYSNCIFE